MIYGLSLPQLAESLDAKVLIVNLWEDCKSVDALLDAKRQLGNHLTGVVLNAVPPQEVEKVKNEIMPSLKHMGIEVFGVMPKSPLLKVLRLVINKKIKCRSNLLSRKRSITR